MQMAVARDECRTRKEGGKSNNIITGKRNRSNVAGVATWYAKGIDGKLGEKIASRRKGAATYISRGQSAMPIPFF